MNKKLIISLLMAVGLAFSAVAQKTNVSVSNFKGNELSIPIGFNYTDATDGKFAPIVGVTYYVTKYIGVRGTTTINVENASAFDNGEFVGLVRLPVYVLSPYVGGGARYQAQADSKWSPVVVAGVEARLNKKWGVFAEARHDFDGGKNTNYRDWSFRGGFNLVLW